MFGWLLFLLVFSSYLTEALAWKNSAYMLRVLLFQYIFKIEKMNQAVHYVPALHRKYTDYIRSLYVDC